ncbi:ZIP family metal transporter [Roseinatronobacter alkalisoli]|uniref:ZIP family metal transporter n=1 Tax=Roseinatronobacter alkalisoli TaxID=3028235 RepID=A0ABT5T816_9RHOB|nr:ZIP family metal transporter [Roseinatronobacter sp. HJB301]MDD7971214.1 ZIP family metal transporter [Roseinatronobacter sp. HJB301]
MSDPTILLVFLAAAITAIATGLGALPLAAMRNVTPRALSYGNAAAAGLMLAATFSLIGEGFAFSGLRTLTGVLLGLGGIWVAKRLLAGNDSGDIANVNKADGLKILLIMGVMTVHSAAEGVGVGVAYGSGRELGDFITIAIALHNVPEGLAIALIMVPRGASVRKAAWWAILSSAPQPVLAVPAFLFVLSFAPFLPIGLGLAAGAMLWMIFSELLPEARDGVDPATTGVIVTLSFALMMGLTLVIG